MNKSKYLFFILLFTILFHQPAFSADAPVRAGIVLGNFPAGTDTPATLQTARCLKAFELYKNGTVNKLIVTGGFTRDHISEARMMKIALVTYGVPPDDIIEEELSSTTIENAIYSAILFEKLGWEKKAMLISQMMHLLRAELIFKERGFKVKSVPSDEPSERPEAFSIIPDMDTAGMDSAGTGEMIIMYEPFNSLEPMNWPSPQLAKRLRAAAALYHKKAAPKIVLFSDWYARGPVDLAQMMRVAVISLGVPPDDAVAVGKIHYAKSADLVRLYGDRTAIVLTDRATAESIEPDSAPLWKYIF